MEDRPGRYRRLVSAFAAFHQASGHRPVLTALASRAPKARRPAQPNQVGAAIRLRSKSPLEFGQRARIVLHAPYHYIWGLVESSEYPSGAYRLDESDELRIIPQVFRLNKESHSVTALNQIDPKLIKWKRRGDLKGAEDVTSLLDQGWQDVLKMPLPEQSKGVSIPLSPHFHW